MKDKKIEDYIYATTEVTFKTLGYDFTGFTIDADDFSCDFHLRKKTVDDIVGIILKFCETYEINWETLVFQTSKKIFNEINQKTLSSNKTVWEMFKERNFEIREKADE